MGRYPTAAFKHGSVDWFAKGISSTFEDVENNKVAFSANDRLGSHLSNLALRSASNLTMPIGIGLSGNSFLACSFMHKNSASLIYTTGNGKAEMELAGCDRDLKYVVDGKLIPNIESQYFAIPVNADVDLTNSAAALQHMPRGVLPYTKKGNFATGYHSSIVFSYPSRLTQPKLVLNFSGTKAGPLDRSVTVSVDGDVQTTVEASYQQITSVDLRLPKGEAGNRVEIAIDCLWSDEETQKIAPGSYPPACLKLVSMRLVS
jgi:hypothetical protein